MDCPGDGQGDEFGDGEWSQASPPLEQMSRGPKLRELLEKAEAAHLRSAARMRALGHEDRARRAEWFAAWVRLELNEPEAARLLYTMTRDLRDVARFGSLLDKALDGALSLLGADRGNVQLFDPVTDSLRIVAACGFGTEFLDYFAVVDDDGSACGRAAAERAQTVIADVRTDPGFAPHVDIAAASGFRAVQSTPLVDRTGRLLGVVSTHYPRPYRPPGRDLQVMRRFGELVGTIMADRLGTFPHGLNDDRPGWTATLPESQPILAGTGSGDGG